MNILRAIRILGFLSAVIFLAECSSKDLGDTDGSGGGDDASVDIDGSIASKKYTWVKNTLDPKAAGLHATIDAQGNHLGVAYFRVAPSEVVVSCPASGVSPAGDKPRPTYELFYVDYNGSEWGSPVKVDETYGIVMGASLAIHSTSGQRTVGYLGGTVSAVECSVSDAMLATSADGVSWNKQTLATSGPVGDTVGYWMSVALDSAGAPHAVYGDFRFGYYYENDDRQKASVRYDQGEAIAENNGAGHFTSLKFNTSDEPVVAFFNPMQKDSEGGIQVGVKSGGVWKLQQLVSGGTEAYPQLNTDGKGVFGLAYFEPGGKNLRYVESKAGLADWKDVVVDKTTTHNGEYSSLAYDSQGNPGISYYRCGPAGATQCDLTKDGLMFSYRQNGVWKVHEVDKGGEFRCGVYSSLTFTANDQPVIAYQCVMFDNTNSENPYVDTLKVTRGVLE